MSSARQECEVTLDGDQNLHECLFSLLVSRTQCVRCRIAPHASVWENQLSMRRLTSLARSYCTQCPAPGSRHHSRSVWSPRNCCASDSGKAVTSCSPQSINRGCLYRSSKFCRPPAREIALLRNRV